jgi:uncharacterized membrane protein
MGAAQAATVKGSVYEWSTLETLSNVIVEIDSQPAQSLVVKSGSYSFRIPAGNYTLEAKYFKNNLLEYHSIETISVANEGDFVSDLIMFPALDVEYFFEAEEFDFDIIFEDEGTAKKNPVAL